MNIYEREFTVSEGTEFTIPAGEFAMCFDIKFPPEGSIVKLIVKQATGTPVGFKVNLYDRAVCALGPEVSQSLVIDAMTAEIAKIMPTHPVDGSYNTAGEELHIGDVVYSYRNREGSYSVAVRKVYLEIIVDDDSEETTWEVAIAADVGGFA